MQFRRDMSGKDIESWKTIFPAAIAEFVGCTFFILIAVGSAMSTQTKFTLPGTVTIGIALAFGFTIFAIAYTIGHISGGHLNCALTLAFVVRGKIGWRRGLAYFVAQFSGSVLGGLLLVGLMPNAFQVNCFASNVLGSGVSPGQALGWEILLTFFLLFVVGAAVDSFKSNQIMVPLAIGMAITVCHFVAIPITGTSLNPTRSIASAIAATVSPFYDCNSVWSDHWIFWIGPCIGAICGLSVYDLLSYYSLGAHGKGENLTKMYRKNPEPSITGAPQSDQIDLEGTDTARIN